MIVMPETGPAAIGTKSGLTVIAQLRSFAKQDIYAECRLKATLRQKANVALPLRSVGLRCHCACYPQFTDSITDFSHAEGDKNSVFNSTNAFGNVAGKLRVLTTNAFTYVEGDVNRDRVVDLSIRLDGAVALVAGDFVL